LAYVHEGESFCCEFCKLIGGQVADIKTVGGWDNSITYYKSDCDMYSRLALVGSKVIECSAGHVFDVGTTLDDPARWLLGARLEEDGSKQSLAGKHYQDLRKKLEAMHKVKLEGKSQRDNSWRVANHGGYGDPFHTPIEVFDYIYNQLNDYGHHMYEMKWDDTQCGVDTRKGLKDMWKRIL
jgi:hypothetical protein